MGWISTSAKALGWATRVIMLLIGIPCLLVGIALLIDSQERQDLATFWIGLLSLPLLVVGMVLTLPVLIGVCVERIQKRVPVPWGSKRMVDADRGPADDA